MVSLVNSHAKASRIGWHLWEIDFRFAPGLPPGWSDNTSLQQGEAISSALDDGLHRIRIQLNIGDFQLGGSTDRKIGDSLVPGAPTS